MRQREILAAEKRKAKKKAKLLKEKEAKKAKEKKKKEREKAKLSKKRAEKRRKKRLIYIKKRYAEKRKEQLIKLKEAGDRVGNFRIIITESGKRVKSLARPKKLLEAYDIYNKLIEENKDNSIGFKKYIKTGGRMCYDANELHYEILLVENVSKEENVYKTSFREDDGKFVESKIVDSNTHVILAKHDWYIADTFAVYGFNPMKDKKTGKWILDNILMKDLSKENTKIVYTLNHRVLIQSDNNLDIITCTFFEDAERLHNDLERNSDNSKYIIFAKKVPRNMVPIFNKKIKDKTGWCHGAVRNCAHVNLVPSVEHKSVFQA